MLSRCASLLFPWLFAAVAAHGQGEVGLRWVPEPGEGGIEIAADQRSLKTWHKSGGQVERHASAESTITMPRDAVQTISQITDGFRQVLVLSATPRLGDAAWRTML